jgi:tetratricopeptide (TPR) repeat protein
LWDNRASKITEDSAHYPFYKGNALWLQGKYGQALEALERAVEIDLEYTIHSTAIAKNIGSVFQT